MTKIIIIKKIKHHIRLEYEIKLMQLSPPNTYSLQGQLRHLMPF